jgi:hypothetical protein
LNVTSGGLEIVTLKKFLARSVSRSKYFPI